MFTLLKRASNNIIQKFMQVFKWYNFLMSYTMFSGGGWWLKIELMWQPLTNNCQDTDKTQCACSIYGTALLMLLALNIGPFLQERVHVHIFPVDYWQMEVVECRICLMLPSGVSIGIVHWITACIKALKGIWTIQEAVAPTVPRRIVPKLRHFHWLLKMNNQRNCRNLGTTLRGTDPTVSATAPRAD